VSKNTNDVKVKQFNPGSNGKLTPLAKQAGKE